MSISQILAILWARKWLALAFVSATLIGATILVEFLPKRYDATAEIYFRLADRDPATNEEVPQMVQRNFLQTQMETIRSPGVALEVVELTGLITDQALKDSWTRATADAGDFPTWIANNVLMNHLVVDRVGSSDIVAVTFRDRDPQRAAQFANAYVSAYIKKSIELRAMPARDLAQWYDQQLQPLQKRLANLNARRSELRNRAVTREEEQGSLVSPQDESAKLGSEGSSARLDLIQAQAALAAAQSLNQPPENDDTRQLRRKLADADSQLAAASLTLGPEHVRIKTLKVTRADLNQQLSNAMKRAIADNLLAARQRVETANQRLKAIDAAIQQDDRNAVKFATAQFGVTSIDREIDALKLQVASIVERGEKLRLTSSVDLTLSSRLTNAVPPATPAFPKKFQIFGFALGLGLPFGAVLAFLREMFDRRIRTPLDIATYTNLPMLAVISTGRPRLRRSASRNRLTGRVTRSLPSPNLRSG